MAFTRITALWSGGNGLPGYSRFRFRGDLTSAEAATAAGRVRTFFNALTSILPSTINISFDGSAPIYDAQGVQTSVVSYTPPAVVNGAVIGPYSAPAGAVVNWLTGFFHNGRQVRGRTFLVPLTTTAYQTDGTLIASTVTAIGGAATALLGGSPSLIVFSDDGAGFTAVTDVTGANVPDKSAVLRSRRD